MALRSINKQNSPSDGRRAFTFSVAALCVIICFAASAIPVPLIAIWTQALALTTFEVSMTVFAYVGGCLAVLLFFSKLSNYFGRKITVILPLLSALPRAFALLIRTMPQRSFWGACFRACLPAW